jgi:hypothetical protein
MFDAKSVTTVQGDVVRDVQRLDRLGGKLGAAPLLDAEVPGNGVEPGGERRAPAEVGKGSNGGQEGLLEHILGVLLPSAHALAEPVDLALVPLQQPL